MSIFTLIMTFASVTQQLDLPAGLLSGLCYVESNHNVEAIHYEDGKGDSLGICQIKLTTARTLGFTGTRAQLMKPKTNVYWAGKYLSWQLKRYKGNIVKAVAAYNAGTHRSSPAGTPMNKKYVGKVFAAWAGGR